MHDLVINITVTLTMSLNHPAPKLAPYRPYGQLLTPPLLLSIFMHLTFTVIVQSTAFFLLQQQPWFNETDVFSACLPLNYSSANVTVREHRYAENFFTTTMFYITGFHEIVVEVVFAKGRPFRQPLYTNYLLSIMIAIQIAVYLFVMFADIETLYTIMELVCTPYYWRVYILIMVLVLFIVSYIAEMWFIENRKLWLWIKTMFTYKSKSQYRRLQRKLQKDPEWPPEDRTDYAIQCVSVEDPQNCTASNNEHKPEEAIQQARK
ncbi:hypothetical protein GDO81_007697 [Engystomops pustulosus]|nr:hypothetical protein GDO81_007697 [Engystomops pustulosus]